MSRAISLVFSLAIAVVIAGGLSMPADARPSSGPPATQAADRASAPGSTPGPVHATHTASRWHGPRLSQRDATRTPRSRQHPGRPPAHAGVRGPPGPSAVPPDMAPDGRSGPATPAPSTPVRAPEATPAGDAQASPRPATDGPTSGAPTGVVNPPAASGTVTADTADPAGRLPVVGAWFGHQIHGLMASPPVLARPQLAPIRPPSTPTAFGLLFGLLGAWYVLQRVAWSRLGHVPLTAPSGPGWDVAHG